MNGCMPCIHYYLTTEPTERSLSQHAGSGRHAQAWFSKPNLLLNTWLLRNGASDRYGMIRKTLIPIFDPLSVRTFSLPCVWSLFLLTGTSDNHLHSSGMRVWGPTSISRLRWKMGPWTVPTQWQNTQAFLKTYTAGLYHSKPTNASCLLNPMLPTLCASHSLVGGKNDSAFMITQWPISNQETVAPFAADRFPSFVRGTQNKHHLIECRKIITRNQCSQPGLKECTPNICTRRQEAAVWLGVVQHLTLLPLLSACVQPALTV